jgi:hypothetical protein
MRHRSYRGTVLYLTDGVGEMGREFFHVTIQPDGTRTLRAVCEMDDDRLLRDVVITLGPDWRPRDAFVRLTVNEAFVGSSWFRFADAVAECEGVTTAEGRISQRFDMPEPAKSFGTHPVHSDAWGLSDFKRRIPGEVEESDGTVFASSFLPNGGSGPLLLPARGRAKRRYIGVEPITVPAGTFSAHRFQFLVDNLAPIEIWATAEDCIPLRLRWDHLRQTYDLVELSGDPR